MADKLPPAGCYDDGCHLIRYLHKHIGIDLNATDAAVALSKIQFSVDRTHFKNHVGKWCRANMNPDDNRCEFLCVSISIAFYCRIVLDNVNTEAAEQSFSWLKRYSSILSALGWRRAPIFLLLLFHMKNLTRCHIRPNKIFEIVNNKWSKKILCIIMFLLFRLINVM